VLVTVTTATGLPVVAAGGVDGPSAVTALLDARAGAVAVGTLLLRTDESGVSRTRFVDAHDATAPPGYPALHHLTRPLRQAAAAAGDPHGVHLWAGTGFRSATNGPARAVVERLARRL
jgi:nitronate monooxygenase